MKFFLALLLRRDNFGLVAMAISTPPGFDSFHTSVPLPGEDDLPCSDGVRMETPKHRRQANILADTLEAAWADRYDFYVGSDMFVYFSELQIKKNDFRGPDVFVVLNTTRRKRKSWVVWQENYRTPDVVIELVSESTEHVDRVDKMRIYSKMLHVSNYYIFDPLSLRLDGFTLDPQDRQRREFVPITPDANGDLPCPVLGLHLGVRTTSIFGEEDEFLRWIDPQGHLLPTDEERVDAVEESLRLAEDHARAVKEKARAVEDHARAVAEKASDEERRRIDAEQRLALALAELERLKAGQ